MRAPAPSPDNTWRRPHSTSDDFEANSATVLIVLFCALTCALALNAAVRCFLPRQQTRRRGGDRKAEVGPAARLLVSVPTVAYAAGMGIVGSEEECAICLSEFEEGEGIKVVGRCRHGFHVECIEEWFRSRTSCPTCRTCCLNPEPDPEPGLGVVGTHLSASSVVASPPQNLSS